MVLFPEVQRRAQKELDHVIGFDRLPTLDDLASLPYVDALCKETVRSVLYCWIQKWRTALTGRSRWQPIVPLGNGHLIHEGIKI